MEAAQKPARSGKRASEIKLLALDMDGTLLDSRSQVLASSVEALKAALGSGITVCLATGKARPAAMTAMSRVGLAGTSQAGILKQQQDTLGSAEKVDD